MTGTEFGLIILIIILGVFLVDLRGRVKRLEKQN